LSDITDRKRAEEELRHSEERYRRLYNDTPVMLHSIDQDGRLISVSNYWLETLGYERSEVLGRISTEFLTAASRSYATEVVIPEFFRIGFSKEVPYQMVKNNGEILDVLLSSIAERDSDGTVVRSLAVMVDVTERKRMAEEIERLNTDLATRAAELEVANRELEAFNYSVAHDLRQPLNIISSYCQVIMELCGDQLDEQCKGYLQGSYEGTLRMNMLIEALLNFSRMGHVEPRRETVDLSAMAHEVAAELKLAEPGRRVTFLIADGVSANGDASLLRVVLDNLLGNAWKYTGMREEAVIEFGATESDGNKAYCVRDNGAGFDMANADKLFTPFRRLPGAEEWRGFGIGLATVERIVRCHGGKVWADGEPGKGATFYFTLG
jgi:PAS domain S-box-containing protein